MGIDLRWEDELGNSIEEVYDPKNIFASLIDKTDKSELICIRFIERYGDTVFNQLQIPIFINELKRILRVCNDTEERKIVKKILILAKKSLGQVHTYLKFYGD